MDISVIGYIVLPIWIFQAVSQLASKSFPSKIATFYHWTILIVSTLLLFGNLIIFHYWGILLNYRAITYLSQPKEVLSSVSTGQIILLILALALVLFVTIRLMRRLYVPLPVSIPSTKYTWVFLGFLPLFLLLGIRGGWQKLPINESLVYYSEKPVLNYASVNPVWHLAYDARMALDKNDNPFTTMDPKIAAAEMTAWRNQQSDSFPKILTINRPNVVVIILESFTADIVAGLGGESGITPNLDSLIQHGLLFENIYSTGFRTDQGIVSVLNGWPATPYHSIIRSEDKCSRLPSIGQTFSKNGYSTTFYYGGESNFSNLNSYVRAQGFQTLVDGSFFDDAAARGQWGVHDQAVLLRQLDDLDKLHQPFFSTVVTLSNHEPFDVPPPVRFSGEDQSSKFRNAAAYTDASLGIYFEQAAKKNWFKNTLFVLVADHAHELPQHKNIIYPEGRRIPLLFYGPALSPSFQGTRCSKLGGHQDLPVTLLKQLSWPIDGYGWSKNLLDQAAPSSAYLPIETYLGWVCEKGWLLWSVQQKRIVEHSKGWKVSDNDTETIRARAFMQQQYDEYLKY